MGSHSNGCFNKCHASDSLKNFLTIGIVERWQDGLRKSEVTSAEVSGAEGYGCHSARPQVECPHPVGVDWMAWNVHLTAGVPLTCL